LSLSRSFVDAGRRADSDTIQAHIFRSAFREEVFTRFAALNCTLVYTFISYAFAVVKILDGLREKQRNTLL